MKTEIVAGFFWPFLGFEKARKKKKPTSVVV